MAYTEKTSLLDSVVSLQSLVKETTAKLGELGLKIAYPTIVLIGSVGDVLSSPFRNNVRARTAALTTLVGVQMACAFFENRKNSIPETTPTLPTIISATATESPTPTPVPIEVNQIIKTAEVAQFDEGRLAEVSQDFAESRVGVYNPDGSIKIFEKGSEYSGILLGGFDVVEKTGEKVGEWGWLAEGQKIRPWFNVGKDNGYVVPEYIDLGSSVGYVASIDGEFTFLLAQEVVRDANGNIAGYGSATYFNPTSKEYYNLKDGIDGKGGSVSASVSPTLSGLVENTEAFIAEYGIANNWTYGLAVDGSGRLAINVDGIDVGYYQEGKIISTTAQSTVIEGNKFSGVGIELNGNNYEKNPMLTQDDLPAMRDLLIKLYEEGKIEQFVDVENDYGHPMQLGTGDLVMLDENSKMIQNNGWQPMYSVTDDDRDTYLWKNVKDLPRIVGFEYDMDGDGISDGVIFAPVELDKSGTPDIPNWLLAPNGLVSTWSKGSVASIINYTGENRKLLIAPLDASTVDGCMARVKDEKFRPMCEDLVKKREVIRALFQKMLTTGKVPTELSSGKEISIFSGSPASK